MIDEEIPTHESDADLDHRSVYRFLIGMAIAVAICSGLVILLAAGMKKRLAAEDPKPSPVRITASERVPDHFPRLQENPEADMAAMRREEDARLTSYAWVDESAGIAQIPIERAIELVKVPSVAQAPVPDPGKAADPGIEAEGAKN